MKRFFFIFAFFLGMNSLFAQRAQVSTGTLTRFEHFASKYVDARDVEVWLPEY